MIYYDFMDVIKKDNTNLKDTKDNIKIEDTKDNIIFKDTNLKDTKDNINLENIKQKDKIKLDDKDKLIIIKLFLENIKGKK